MRKVSLERYYFVLYDGALTLQTSKMTLNPFCDKTLQWFLPTPDCYSAYPVDVAGETRKASRLSESVFSHGSDAGRAQTLAPHHEPQAKGRRCAAQIPMAVWRGPGKYIMVRKHPHRFQAQRFMYLAQIPIWWKLGNLHEGFFVRFWYVW